MNLSERVVASMWERQAFDPSALSGYAVVFRGIPSDAGGADYQDAILVSSDGTLHEGDVEFHVRSSDWYRHRHHLDRAYDRVILHVVWEEDDGETRRTDGTVIPRLSVAGTAPPAFQVPLLPSDLQCIGALSAWSSSELIDVLAGLAAERFWSLADRFEAETETLSSDQVLYLALLEGMGYASNRQVFRELGERAPFAWLCSIPRSEWTGALLYVAGLSPQPDGDTRPRSKDRTPAPMLESQWRLTRLRPANRPERRIVGISRLLTRLGGTPTDFLVDAVLRAESPAVLRRLLVVEESIGQGRADELAVSVILPFVAGSGLSQEVRPRSWELYSRYPAPPATRWTRLMVERCRQAGHTVSVNRAVSHQGLHALYHRHCRNENRLECRVCGPRGTVVRL